MFYVRGIISLIYVDTVLLFGTDQDTIGKFIKELQYCVIQLTVEQDVYGLLGVEVNTDNHSGKFTMTE